jgi:hypothetical protein
MKYKPYYFLASAFFASYLLISKGVPPIPVLAGCLLAALFTWWKIARQTSLRR